MDSGFFSTVLHTIQNATNSYCIVSRMHGKLQKLQCPINLYFTLRTVLKHACLSLKACTWHYKTMKHLRRMAVEMYINKAKKKVKV